MGSIPRSLFVLIVLVIGVLFLYFSQPPFHVCDAHMENFRKSQEGKLYVKKIKKIPYAPTLKRSVESCMTANGPGGCFELFATLKSVVSDAGPIAEECGTFLANEPQIQESVNGGIELMALLAWGAKPPEKGSARFSWFQATELLLFCQLQRLFVKMNGETSYESYRLKILNRLPGEEATYKDGVCTNCDARKKAVEVLSFEEIWARSIFSFRCDQLL